jgi:hypothetical protein
LPDFSNTIFTQALHAQSPRWSAPPTPLPSILIHGAVLALWIALFANAFLGKGIAGWSVGIVYIGYDTVLLVFTFLQCWTLRQPAPEAPVVPAERLSLTVIIAAYNEAEVLASTLDALARQSSPPDEILIADDGSTDGTAALLGGQYRLFAAPGEISDFARKIPGLRWLRLAHAGKAAALNQALAHVSTDVFVTVDADTKLAPDALAAMRNAFSAMPGLVAATGVLAPVCNGTCSGRLFEWFQTYEYVRNFLSRYAWGRMDALLLISGAFAGFRREAVVTVGGFDPDCLVEDYELIHRLRRYGYLHGLGWHSLALGSARATTSAAAAALVRRVFTDPVLVSRYGGQCAVQAPGHLDAAGESRRYDAADLWFIRLRAADFLYPNRPGRRADPGGRVYHRQNHPRSGLSRLVDPAVSQLDRRRDADPFRHGAAGGDIGAVQFSVAAASGRELGMGLVCNRPAELELSKRSLFKKSSAKILLIWATGVVAPAP